MLFSWLNHFDEPTSRLYYWNIISSLVLLFIFLVYKSQTFNFKKFIFNKNYWWNISTKQDYVIYFLNAGLKAIIFVPLFECSFLVAKLTLNLVNNFTDFERLHPSSELIVVFTLGVFIWDDFLRFIHHFFMHKVPWLWQLHKTHHSARVLTPISLFRTHPLESLIAVLRNSLSWGVATGLYVALFGSAVNVWTLAGVNGFGFLFNFLGANLRHSHIPFSFGILEKVFISPLQHQVHHSKNPEHYDKNFGVSLSFWDAIFGSLVLSKHINNTQLKFGLSEKFEKNLFFLFFPIFKNLSFSSKFTINLKKAFHSKPIQVQIKSRESIYEST